LPETRHFARDAQVLPHRLGVQNDFKQRLFIVRPERFELFFGRLDAKVFDFNEVVGCRCG
jgi:hypothetical protein